MFWLNLIVYVYYSVLALSHILDLPLQMVGFMFGFRSVLDGHITIFRLSH